jgi:hypothetical protein
LTRLWPEGEAVELWGGGTEGAACHPYGFIWHGVYHHILDVCNCWRVHTRWWDPDIVFWREYLKVTTDQGVLCLLYRDLHSGDWFLARVYD